MNKLFLSITIWLCFLAQTLFAQISHIKLLTPEPLMYEKTEFDIELKAKWQNPYLQEDIALDMILTSPSGKKLTLPCYYVSGASGAKSLWKARFTSREKGKYSYVFQLSKAGKVADTSSTGSFISNPSKGYGFLHIQSNWILQFDNGKPFRGIGENIAWESRANDDSKFFSALHEQSKYNYEYMLRSLKAHGGNFFRTWISPFNLPVDWRHPVNTNRYKSSDEYFNPSAIAKMDRLVQLCDSLHIFMMLTLGEGASSVKAGGFSPTQADFFVNPLSKQRYKNRLRYFIARWGYSPSIAAWELFNEVDNVEFADKDKPINADSIVQWHNEMSTYIRNTDPYHHLITTSVSHRDLKGLDSLHNIDFNQKHIYKNTAGIPDAITHYEKAFGKPYVIGEYSYEWDWNKNFNDFALEMDSDFKRGLWYGLFSPTPILPMSWWWEYFDERKTDAYINHVRYILNMMLAAGKGSFKQVEIQASAPVTTYAVKCGKRIFIYVYNRQPYSSAFQLRLPTLHTHHDFTVYDCENGFYQKPGSIKAVADRNIIRGNLSANTDAVFILNE